MEPDRGPRSIKELQGRAESDLALMRKRYPLLDLLLTINAHSHYMRWGDIFRQFKSHILGHILSVDSLSAERASITEELNALI